jgi:hypothetical protein
MKECEEEFDYQKNLRRTHPRIIVPAPSNPILSSLEGSTPAFLGSFRIDRATRQTVNTKLDSVLIKGSKILEKSGKSKYIPHTLFLMAKSYYYKEEWLPSQIKCSELIDKEPTGQ